jgi:hypothetical protein
MQSKIWLALLLLLVVGVVGAQAVPQCSCSCASSCTAPCVASGIGVTNCCNVGRCTATVNCGGHGCGVVSVSAKSLFEQIMEQPAVAMATASVGEQSHATATGGCPLGSPSLFADLASPSTSTAIAQPGAR